MTIIYVLKCRSGKYYVGKTKKTAMTRYKEHVAGRGCAWTCKYKPTELIECFQGDKFDEDKKMIALPLKQRCSLLMDLNKGFPEELLEPDV